MHSFSLALAFFSDNRVIKIVERIVLKAHAKIDDMKTHFLIGPVLFTCFFYFSLTFVALAIFESQTSIKNPNCWNQIFFKDGNTYLIKKQDICTLQTEFLHVLDFPVKIKHQ